MAWRTGGGLLVVCGLIAAIFIVGRSAGSSDPCVDPPVLAADRNLVVADDCVDTISLEGKTFYVTCIEVHPSRKGDSFLENGGDTVFDGASEIVGVPRNRAFLLDGSPCRRNTTIAMSELPSGADVKALESVTSTPVGQPEQISLSATKVGFSLSENRLGAVALLRNATRTDATDIKLDVEFLDSDGEILWTIKENLPFCPARMHCWWGSSWPSEPYDDASHLASVRVTAKAGTAERDVGAAVPFMLKRQANGSIEGVAPVKEGIAVLIVSSGGHSYGLMLNVKEGFGFGRRIQVGADMLPPIAPGEAVRGFMYPMKIPLGSYMKVTEREGASGRCCACSRLC